MRGRCAVAAARRNSVFRVAKLPVGAGHNDINAIARTCRTADPVCLEPALRKGLEVTAIDGTTMELAGNDALAGESGTPADGARPLLRITAHVRTASSRWTGAAIGGYHDGENALADQIGRHAI
jgi:hypothetical protein